MRTVPYRTFPGIWINKRPLQSTGAQHKKERTVAFQEVDAPFGAFIGWNESKKGQHVTGKVTDYDEFTGRDFSKRPCPLVEVELTEQAQSFNKKGERTVYKAGDTVQVTCGLGSLKRAIKHAELKRGDIVKIVLDDFLDVNDGTAKLFKVYVDRSGATSSTDDSDSLADDDADSDDIPF